MKYTLEQYIEMSKKFNKKTFVEKIKTLIENPNLLILGCDHNWWVVKVIDKEIQEELEQIDEVFQIENEWGSNEMDDLVFLLGLKTTDA